MVCSCVEARAQRLSRAPRLGRSRAVSSAPSSASPGSASPPSHGTPTTYSARDCHSAHTVRAFGFTFRVIQSSPVREFGFERNSMSACALASCAATRHPVPCPIEGYHSSLRLLSRSLQ